MIDDKCSLALVVMAVNTNHSSWACIFQSCTEIEHKKKYKMPIILLVTQSLHACRMRASFDVAADKIHV